MTKLGLAAIAGLAVVVLTVGTRSCQGDATERAKWKAEVAAANATIAGRDSLVLAWFDRAATAQYVADSLRRQRQPIQAPSTTHPPTLPALPTATDSSAWLAMQLQLETRRADANADAALFNGQQATDAREEADSLRSRHQADSIAIGALRLTVTDLRELLGRAPVSRQHRGEVYLAGTLGTSIDVLRDVRPSLELGVSVPVDRHLSVFGRAKQEAADLGRRVEVGGKVSLRF